MTTLFIVSLCGILGMLASKVFEIKVKKIQFLSDLFDKGDQKIHGLVDIVATKYNRYKLIANLFVFDFLPAFFYELLVRTKDFVAKKYYEASDGFRGRRILKSTGSVSFFLERLAEEEPQRVEVRGMK